MQRLLSLLIFLAIFLCACTVQSGSPASAAPVDGGTQEQQKEVRAAAKILVARLDAGQYAEAWAMAGPSLAAKTTQAEFVRYISALREPLGAAGKRTIKGFGFPTELEGAPRGQYGVIAVETDFANSKAVEEKLVFELVGGKWRLVGYWLSKTLTIGAAQMRNNAITAPSRPRFESVANVRSWPKADIRHRAIRRAEAMWEGESLRHFVRWASN